MPTRHAVVQDVVGSVDQPFELARDVRVHDFGFLGLLLLDRRLARRWLRFLRDNRRRGSSRQGDDREQRPHSTAHG